MTTGTVGPTFAGKAEDGEITSVPTNGVNGTKHEAGIPDICVVDADDLLDNPYEMVEAYCGTVGLKYTPEMLHWEDEENQKKAKEAFEKWRGFHEDAIDSTELRPRTHVSCLMQESSKC